MTDAVIDALCAMRPPFALYEADLHRMVGDRLSECGFIFQHEAPIAKGCRIDYLVGTVGVEIKKGKPQAAGLIKQLLRYAMSDCVQSFVVVSWQRVTLPRAIAGKPVKAIVLSQLWGVSLP